MKGYRFYAVMPEARKSKSASKANPFFPWTVKALAERAGERGLCDVLALPLDESGLPLWHNRADFLDLITTAIEGDDSSYGYASGTMEFIRTRCTRVPESLARELAPRLFRYLES